MRNPTGSVSFAEFLSQHPPGADLNVTEYGLFNPKNQLINLNTPPIQLYCNSEICDDLRFFDGLSSTRTIGSEDPQRIFIHYHCRHCKESNKIYALEIHPVASSTEARIIKIGEYPLFGQTTPARVIAIIGPDKELFLKGRRSEVLGLGIGAFAYYRRVVENQKDRIIDEIIKVAKMNDTTISLVPRLEEAKSLKSFEKSVEMIKDSIPQSLFIREHNPLTLLHSALSKGLHQYDESVCLQAAKSIRLVLVELSERIGVVAKDQTELLDSIRNLLDLERKNEKKQES